MLVVSGLPSQPHGWSWIWALMVVFPLWQRSFLAWLMLIKGIDIDWEYPKGSYFS